MNPGSICRIQPSATLCAVRARWDRRAALGRPENAAVKSASTAESGSTYRSSSIAGWDASHSSYSGPSACSHRMAGAQLGGDLEHLLPYHHLRLQITQYEPQLLGGLPPVGRAEDRAGLGAADEQFQYLKRRLAKPQHPVAR